MVDNDKKILAVNKLLETWKEKTSRHKWNVEDKQEKIIISTILACIKDLEGAIK